MNNKLGFQATEAIEPEELTPLAQAVGCRLVGDAAGWPISYSFVPDVGRAGEFEWANRKDPIAYQKAYELDPSQEPAVVLKSDLMKVLKMADMLRQVGMDLWSLDENEALERLLSLTK